MNKPVTITPAQPTGNAAATAGATPAIAVDRLSHRYAPTRRAKRKQQATLDRPALDGVSFQVQPGEIFGILGPNGGGKTTLFRILSTMLCPTAPEGQQPGSAAIFGNDVVTHANSVRASLGVVFQQPSLDGKLTAYENLLHQGKLYGIAGKDLQQRISQWLERFNLADRQNDDTEHFSGGMRRRVELAKALLHQPRLLLMDEPATGLDPGARRDVWQHLHQLRDELGTTVVLTTHLMDEAERCDRLAILAQGKLVAVDTPANLKALIGGDVITVELPTGATADELQTLAGDIEERFGPWLNESAPKVVDQAVRFEKEDGAGLVAQLATAWPGRFKRLTVGQPTLEDVFLHLTGAAFTDDA